VCGIGLCRFCGDFFLCHAEGFFSVCWWHPRFVIGLFALPLCGAAVTFFAAAKKVTKESSFQPPVPAKQTLRHALLELSHRSREHSGPAT
jgi:hypothetical protein